MALVLKTDDKGVPALTDDKKIIYLDDENDNQELPLDPVAMYDKIGTLGRENQTVRTARQEAEGKLIIFKDVEDLEAYKTEADKAIAQVKNFNDDDWMKADKVDKLKGEITEAYEGKLNAKDAVITDLQTSHEGALATKDGHIHKLMVSNRFAVSPHFIAHGDKKPKTTLPPDIGEAQFGQHFKVEEKDGKLILRAYQGKDMILSRINPGEPAGFEESLSIIIDAYPGKNSILSASSSGSGGQGGDGQGAGDHDELADLKKQYDAAITSGQGQLAINLKNRIFDLEQALKKAS